MMQELWADVAEINRYTLGDDISGQPWLYDRDWTDAEINFVTEYLPQR